MIPKYRVWDKELRTMLDVSLIDFKKGVLVCEHWEFFVTRKVQKFLKVMSYIIRYRQNIPLLSNTTKTKAAGTVMV